MYWTHTCGGDACARALQRQQLCDVDDDVAAGGALVEVRAAGQRRHQLRARRLPAHVRRQQQLVQVHQPVLADDFRLRLY